MTSDKRVDDSLPEDEGHAITDRELLARVDERSMVTTRLVQRVETGLNTFRDAYRRDMILLRDRLEAIEADLKKVPAIAKASADESGEHIHQELLNLREELARKEKQILEKDLADARAEIADGVKRRRDLVWEIIKWGIIAILTALLAVVGVAPHLGHG